MKPDDVPQDVWNTVVAIDLMDWVNNLDGDRDPKEAIARAILAARAEEREACAVAVSAALNTKQAKNYVLWANLPGVRAVVSEAIRKRGESP